MIFPCLAGWQESRELRDEGSVEVSLYLRKCGLGSILIRKAQKGLETPLTFCAIARQLFFHSALVRFPSNGLAILFLAELHQL